MGFWVTFGVNMMSLRHGWGLQPTQTASRIHISHIQSVWAHWHAIHRHTVAALNSNTHILLGSDFVHWGYGANLGGSLCNTSKMYVQWVRLTSHKSETAQKAQTTWQTTSPWCWSCSPLQRHGFDEPMPPEGWEALHMFVPRPPSKQFTRFNKLK